MLYNILKVVRNELLNIHTQSDLSAEYKQAIAEALRAIDKLMGFL